MSADRKPRSPADDRRQERRYPVVGIAVLYSPSEGKCLEDAGRLVRQAFAYDMSLSGLSFDVSEPLEPEDELFIEIADPTGQAERILAEVRWCRKIEEHHYRIGTWIKQAAAMDHPGTTAGLEAKPIGKGAPVPSEVDFECPACGNQTIFALVGLQSGSWKQGLLPLYQCSLCQSSRAITGLLAHKRGGSR